MTSPVATPGVSAWPLLTRSQRLAVNGRDLNLEFGTIANSLAALTATPKKRGDNITVPGRHGALHTVRKLYDQQTIVLSLLVAASKPDGSIPLGSSARSELWDRFNDLARLFAADQITLDHTERDGTTRRIVGEVIDTIPFDRDLAQSPPHGVFKVAIRCADPFWTDLQTVTQQASLTTGSTVMLSQFALSSAPISSMLITFLGPISNPTIVQPATGVYMAYDGIVAAGQKLLVDTGQWLLSPADGVAWTPNYGALRHQGASGRWFEIAPADPAPVVLLSHTGGGSATVQITAANRYLIA